MNRWIKVTLVAGGLASAGLVGYGAGKMGAYAQGGPGPGPGMMTEGGPRGPGMGPGMMGPRGEGGQPQWMMGEHGRRGDHRGYHAHGGRGGTFAQFFINRDNKNLTNDDVKKIAEAGLLWFGERNWRIGEVKDAGSRAAEFTLTTENGGVIARFTMDRDTGRVRRIG
ncbi:hypothetical protein [Elioraea rosea]|uniref:hypothetical protein n=1 Tax=Elioraea rosea TaxID=2492390 RepID=UPI00118637BD|nr:hypothetical protein [Elioraea rosea]